MIEADVIQKFIEDGYECDYLDFKKTQYRRENFHELIIDVMSMANSNSQDEKFIIIGVKDIPNGSREIVGVPHEEFYDASIYQNIVLENIEPELRLDYFPFVYKSKQLGIIQIHTTNSDRPYMLKKQYSNLHVGLCKVRKGSNNLFVTRKDIDSFFASKELFEVKFMDNNLMAVYSEIGCAVISITIRNYTHKPVVINYGELLVCDKNGNKLSYHRVYGFDNKYTGADFKLSFAPMEEKLGDIYVGFGSSDCLRLEIDEFGCAKDKFVFKLILCDTNGNEYSCMIDKGVVYAKGDFLWKVQLKAKEEKKNEKRRMK